MKLGVPQTPQSIIKVDCMTTEGRSASRNGRASTVIGTHLSAISSEGMAAWLRSGNTLRSWRVNMYSANSIPLKSRTRECPVRCETTASEWTVIRPLVYIPYLRMKGFDF
jgi:hypothetical protein